MPFVPAIVAGVATVATTAARVAPAVIRAVGAAGRVTGKVADIANQAQNQNQRRSDGGSGGVGDSMHLTHDDVVGMAEVPTLNVRLEDSDRREHRRNLVGLCGVPQYNFDMCKDQLAKGKKVESSIPSKGGKCSFFLPLVYRSTSKFPPQSSANTSYFPSTAVAKFVNIPPACMNLAVVLSGSCTGEGTRPVPCGSDCMQYTGLNDQQMMFLSKALKG